MKNIQTVVRQASSAIFTAALLVACSSPPPPPPPKQDTLIDYIKAGRNDKAKELFRGTGNANESDSDGNSALHLVAQMDQPELVDVLVSNGASTTVRNADGDTPLHAAIKASSLEATRKLVVKSGDGIFARDAEGNTALDLALARGESWYDAVITKDVGDILDADGQNIVHYFVKTRNELAIDTCVEQGVNLSVVDKHGQTPLELAYESADDPAAIRIAAKLLLANVEPVGGQFEYFENAVLMHDLRQRDDSQTPLHLASISGHAGIVDYILNDPVFSMAEMQDALQAQDRSGSTPLHEAVRYGRLEIVKMLLEKGARVNALDSLGKTPLLLIIPKKVQQDIYQTLIEHGANISQKDMYGDTVLHVATMCRASKDIIEFLLASGAPINERNKQGVTPLALAIDQDRGDYALLYANHGADIHAEDMQGNSPLMLALRNKTPDMLLSIITEDTIKSRDSAGNTPLHVAIMMDASMDYINIIVDSMIKNHVDINARNKSGDSALYLTVEKNKKAEGELLLDKGADIFSTNTQDYSPLRLALEYGGSVQDWLITSQTLNITDGSGNTPLHYAAEWRLDDAVIGLLQKGAKISAVNANGESPLFSAVKGGSISCIELLIDNGAVVNSRNSLARDFMGNTTLHAAVRWDRDEDPRLDVARTLISLGVDIDAQNQKGQTALGEACQSTAPKFAIAKLLIEKGANVNSADSTGRSILTDSIRGNNEQIVQMLLSKGANPNIQDSAGRNAYHEAAKQAASLFNDPTAEVKRKQSMDIIRMVRDAGANPLARDRAGNTPFSLVLGTNDDVLIQTVLGSDLTIVDSNGNTPIHIAVERKVPARTLLMLLDAGYPVSQRNGDGVTALYNAVAQNQQPFADILLQRGADPYVETNKKDCALSLAMTTKNLRILDSLVKYCGTKTDMKGDGILHYAARYADKETTEHLLAQGLDKSVKNYSGEIPTDMARRWRKLDVAELLKP